MTLPAYLSRASLAAQLDVCEATPMRLDEAARVLLHGLVTKSTLRAAINRGDLIAERIGRILVVTPRAVLDWRRQPDDGPCDHLLDMLSSCASAIRFGLEKPCTSRYAAAAANHIWSHLYGVHLFDQFTDEWQKDWARAQLQAAITGLALAHQPGRREIAQFATNSVAR